MTGLTLKIGTFKIGQQLPGGFTPSAPWALAGFASATTDTL